MIQIGRGGYDCGGSADAKYEVTAVDVVAALLSGRSRDIRRG